MLRVQHGCPHVRQTVRVHAAQRVLVIQTDHDANAATFSRTVGMLKHVADLERRHARWPVFPRTAPRGGENAVIRSPPRIIRLASSSLPPRAGSARPRANTTA